MARGGCPTPLDKRTTRAKSGQLRAILAAGTNQHPLCEPPLSEGAEGNVKEGDDHE